MDSFENVMVFGHRGQDGTLLRENLASAGVRVIGVSRDLVEIFDHTGSLVSSSARPESVRATLEKHRPREIFYLAAEHYSSEGPVGTEVKDSWSKYYTANIAPYESLLESIVALSLSTRVFYAASSLVFEGSDAITVDERTPYAPISDYAQAKVRGIELGQAYRRRGVWVSSGVLFNHESHLRPRTFFSSKVVLGAIEISSGVRDQLQLRDFRSVADWGYARDFVRAFRLALSMEEPRDFIIATGQQNSSARFAELAFNSLGLDWRKYVVEQPGKKKPLRPALRAQISQFVDRTGWSDFLTFEQLVPQLVADHLAAKTSP